MMVQMLQILKESKMSKKYNLGDIVVAASNVLTVKNHAGQDLKTKVPEGTLGTILAFNPELSSYWVSWDSGRSGYVSPEDVQHPEVNH
jgi:hypothetical protein